MPHRRFHPLPPATTARPRSGSDSSCNGSDSSGSSSGSSSSNSSSNSSSGANSGTNRQAKAERGGRLPAEVQARLPPQVAALIHRLAGPAVAAPSTPPLTASPTLQRELARVGAALRASPRLRAGADAMWLRDLDDLDDFRL